MKVTSSFTVARGCFVPLYEDVPQAVKSLNETMPMFWLQSITFGMHTFDFQFLSTLGEKAFLLKVFAPTVR